ncbi:uncharacterized protein Z519_10137 [Cladophialophora bantiana CBS 173.52]|uniref:Phytocyanin domain-containing protein n=1 Tax=Cladophialophora bantiana (strain ATCC 10958 / CBS 173.52 / CDC B-1940 / NIH 8579) TaxID=1442370 RepID=A0A0D2HXF7_CLAB1|nr:uncharacterized protein Z519_10137 [Cladophialophora bantiana CBS 173.52]KIW89284.1 hypothetical protein Z519_10137 [Cladophialophora bantiana CBS 173.52]
MRLSFLALSALLSAIVAQDTTTTVTDYTSAESTSPTSTSSQPITVTVAVGNGGNTFVPDVVQVSPGNYVEFNFYPLNHSVIRAEYLYPCVPYELTGADKVGFFSGFYPVDAILSDPPKWTLLINDTNPIFYYCGAQGSCINYQMVGVINPNASQSLQTQKQYAADSTQMLLPGQGWPDEDPSAPTSTTIIPYTTTSTTSTVTPTPTSTTSSATETSTASGSDHSTLSTGAIAGIAVGGAAVVVGAAALLFFCGRRSRSKGEGGSQPAPSTPAMGPMNNPPAYIPPNNYGYMSPTQKHMSVTTASSTDAFGNAIPNGGMYPYPQGYPPPQQTPQNMMASPGQPQPSPQWPPTPSNDIFGAAIQPIPAPGPYPMHDTQYPRAGSGIVTENTSMRASSPNSVAGPPAASGIEAFLQRQSRMSPPPENEVQLQQQPPPVVASGPFEMSATGTMHRYP